MKIEKYAGINGVDKSVDRKLIEAMIVAHAGHLGEPVGNGKCLLECLFDNVKPIVISLARAGYLTPEEVESSPTLCDDIQLEVRKAEEAEAKRKSDIEDANAAAREALRKAQENLAEVEAAAAK